MEVSTRVDAYSARARLLPGLLTVLLVAVTAYAWDLGTCPRLARLLSMA